MNPASGQDSLRRGSSRDGTEITARVSEEGPAVVLLPAGPGDSELSWGRVVSFMSEQCACHMLEARGRGESADQPDHSPDWLVDDVLAHVESLGELIGLVGWGSALWARVAAHEDARLFAVAPYEPGAGEEGMRKESGERMGEVFKRVSELVGEGRLVDAARAFIEGSDATDSEEDLAAGAPAQFREAAAPRLPLILRDSEQAAGSGQPGATSPSELGRITMPLLLLHGDRTSKWFDDSVKHVAEHVAGAALRRIPGAAHFGPHTDPRAVAEEIGRFFTESWRAAAES